MNKCHQCLFEDEFRDMGATIPVCNRCNGLQEAIEAHSSPTPCRWHITIAEVIELQEESSKYR